MIGLENLELVKNSPSGNLEVTDKMIFSFEKGGKNHMWSSNIAGLQCHSTNRRLKMIEVS